MNTYHYRRAYLLSCRTFPSAQHDMAAINGFLEIFLSPEYMKKKKQKNSQNRNIKKINTEKS